MVQSLTYQYYQTSNIIQISFTKKQVRSLGMDAQDFISNPDMRTQLAHHLGETLRPGEFDRVPSE
jgi:hypothetical protein